MDFYIHNKLIFCMSRAPFCSDFNVTSSQETKRWWVHGPKVSCLSCPSFAMKGKTNMTLWTVVCFLKQKFGFRYALKSTRNNFFLNTSLLPEDKTRCCRFMVRSFLHPPPSFWALGWSLLKMKYLKPIGGNTTITGLIRGRIPTLIPGANPSPNISHDHSPNISHNHSLNISHNHSLIPGLIPVSLYGLCRDLLELRSSLHRETRVFFVPASWL